MLLHEFINRYDQPGTIVLLEGKRNVKETDVAKLLALGEMITKKTKHILFRSGNAQGADFYFAQGVTSVNTMRLQVITPYSKHRNKTNKAHQIFSLDDICLASEPEVVYFSKKHKSTEKLIDGYAAGKRD